VVTTSHPLEPSQRRAATIGKRIVIEKRVLGDSPTSDIKQLQTVANEPHLSKAQSPR